MSDDACDRASGALASARWIVSLRGMNCVSCQAALAPRSSHCFFCGAAQPVQPSNASNLPRAGGPAGYAQWVASSAPHPERWRIWASFFLAGLYAPIASRFLYRREEWNAGVGQSSAAPVAPSSRGLVVIGLFFGLPVVCILVLGFMIAASKAGWYPNEQVARGLGEAHAFGYLNLFVACFYAGSALAALHVERRFVILLYELTAGDQVTLRAFRKGRVRRWLARAVACLPLTLIVYANVVMVTQDWNERVDPVSGFYLFAVLLATWCTSWLHVHPLGRFRRAMVARP